MTTALHVSLAEQLAGLRGHPAETLPAPLLDVVLETVALPGGDVVLPRPRDWQALRDAEALAQRPIPYWARSWPSGVALAGALAHDPPRPGRRVLELGCGLGLPSIVAGRANTVVLATDGATDAVAYAAHGLALNGVEAEVAHVDWSEHGEALVQRGPWDLVLAADVLYTRGNVESALRLFPRLMALGGELVLADPDRAGTRDFLAAARASLHLWTRREGDVALHRLTAR